MAKKQVYLTDAQLLVIACAPADARPLEVAQSAGAPYPTVAHALKRMRRDGWCCPVVYRPCVACGRDICSPARSPRIVHTFCARAHTAAQQRTRRQGDHTPSTQYVRAWKQREPERARALYEQEKARMRQVRRDTWSPDQWAPVIERVHAADRRDQELTLELAENTGTHWTEEEDQYVWSHLKTAAREVAAELGRTLWSVRGRRVRLRRRFAAEQRRAREAAAGKRP